MLHPFTHIYSTSQDSWRRGHGSWLLISIRLYNLLLPSGYLSHSLADPFSSNNRMFPGITILVLGLSALLASAAPFKERSGAPINGMTLTVDSGKLCEGHQVNISWGDTSLGAVSCHPPWAFHANVVASRHTVFKLVLGDTTRESTGPILTITLLNHPFSGTSTTLPKRRCKSTKTAL